MPGDLCTAPRISSLSPLSLVTDVIDVTLGASDLWLGTRTEAGGTATLTKSFSGRNPWLYGQQETSVVSKSACQSYPCNLCDNQHNMEQR
jgi:hypothetical protein